MGATAEGAPPTGGRAATIGGNGSPSSLSLAALLTVLVALLLPQSGASFQTLPRKMPPRFDAPRPTLLAGLLSLYSPPSLIIEDRR